MSDYVKIPADAIPELRWALSHGLYAATEISRSRSHFDFMERNGQLSEVLKAARPICSLASEGDMTRYAEALIWLNHITTVED